jgi:hypothetical protein
MKLRFLLAAVMVAGLVASAAIAAPPPGKGKPLPTGAGCKPKVTVVLKGTVDSASASSVSVDVTSSNRWGRSYVPGTGLTAVGVDTNTKVRRNGNTTSAAGLLKGDRVLVQARACKADLAGTTTPPLMAARVVAHPAKA